MHLPETGFTAIGIPLSSVIPSMATIPSRVVTEPNDTLWPTLQLKPQTDPRIVRLSLPVSGVDTPLDPRFGPFMLAHRVFQRTWMYLTYHTNRVLGGFKADDSIHFAYVQAFFANSSRH